MKSTTNSCPSYFEYSVLAIIASAIILPIIGYLYATPTEPTYTIINTSSKASPATVFSMAYKNATRSDWYQAQNCEDGIRAFNNTENAIMSYNSSIEFAARNKGLNCKLEGVDPTKVLFIGETPVNICRAKGSDIDFGSERTTLGMASMYATQLHEDKFVDAGANVKIVPFSGSKTVLAALKAGDIDLGWIGSGLAMKHSSSIDCLYSTDPNLDNYVGKRLSLAVPDFRITFVLYTNGDTPKLNQEEFDKFLTNRNIFKNEVSEDGINNVVEYVDTMFNNWSEKANAKAK